MHAGRVDIPANPVQFTIRDIGHFGSLVVDSCNPPRRLRQGDLQPHPIGRRTIATVRIWRVEGTGPVFMENGETLRMALRRARGDGTARETAAGIGNRSFE